MALRTMAAKLKIKWPFAVSRPPPPEKSKKTATTGSEEFSRAMEELAELMRKSRKDEEFVRVAGVGLAALTLSLGIRRLHTPQ